MHAQTCCRRVAKHPIFAATNHTLLVCSLVEGKVLDDYMSGALEKQAPQQYVATVAEIMQKLLQVHPCHFFQCLLSA